MWSASTRALFGFIAAALSVLTFHQGLIALLHALGLVPFTAYPTWAVPPFGVPMIVNLCFWGGLYGLVFGLLLPRFAWPTWLCGVILGVIAGLVGLFIVAPIKGVPVAANWHPVRIALVLIINAFWGLGVGVILPLMLPRNARRRRLA